MAKTATKEAIVEKIDILDQLEGKKEHKSFKRLFLVAPAAVLTAATSIFFVARRIRNKREK